MLTLVIYDISDNAIRNRICELCKDHGLARLQKSAFFGELGQDMIQRISNEVKAIMNNKSANETDSTVIFPICDTCLNKQICIGNELIIDDYKDCDYYFVD